MIPCERCGRDDHILTRCPGCLRAVCRECLDGKVCIDCKVKEREDEQKKSKEAV